MTTDDDELTHVLRTEARRLAATVRRIEERNPGRFGEAAAMIRRLAAGDHVTPDDLAEASALRAERDAAQAEAATREEEVERLTLERDTERSRLEEADRRTEAERTRAAVAKAREGELRAERDRLSRQWEMAQARRKTAEDELTAWTAGGPGGR